MDYKMDSGWRLYPIGGDTGQAYMGTRADEKVFLKRNSSPFLAALSVEGITPKLIWTKRVGNGDILTAQEWLNGRELKPGEMKGKAVIDILHRIHQSENLFNMLQKVKGEVYNPMNFLNLYIKDLPEDLKSHALLQQAVQYVKATAASIAAAPKTVCHGDVNRKNFLLDNAERLYLVDWEMVKIADPLSDISMLLTQYVALEDWNGWLEEYGLEMTDDISRRLEWYSIMNCLIMIKKNHLQGRELEMNQTLLLLKELYQNRINQDL